MYISRNLGTKLLLATALLIYLILNPFSFGEIEAADHPILYFFWGEGCPHCEEEKEFLQTLPERYPELEMRWFETWNHPEFAQLADTLRQAYELKRSSVPLTFIGNWSQIGYISEEKTGIDIEEQIISCIQQQGCPDPIVKIGPREIALIIEEQARKNKPVGWELFPATKPPRPPEEVQLIPEETPTPSPVTTPESSPQPTPESTPGGVQTPSQPPENSSAQNSGQNPDTTDRIVSLPIPFIGKDLNINIAQISLPLFTVIIGGLDGFNPCAMWVLCFLLTLVIYAKSRAKILLIGGIFVLASGGIYFLFMIAWLNIYKLVGYIKLLTKIIGTVAIVIGLINCKDFFFFKKGISLTIPESAQPKLFKQMRDIIHTSALPSVILGTIVLAVTANLIELLCTAGLPAIYTGILEMQNFSKIQEYLYLVLYNVVYVVPLAVIVGVFAWKMGGRKLTEKEGRILKLVSGVLMLTLGIILIVKPQILMFG